MHDEPERHRQVELREGRACAMVPAGRQALVLVEQSSASAGRRPRDARLRELSAVRSSVSCATPYPSPAEADGDGFL